MVAKISLQQFQLGRTAAYGRLKSRSGHLLDLNSWANFLHSFLIWNVVFPGQAEYSYFSAYFSLKIFFYYSWIIIEKERIYHILFAVCSFIFLLYSIDMYFNHVPFIELSLVLNILALTNAGFFLLLGSFAAGGSNDLIRLSYKHIF